MKTIQGKPAWPGYAQGRVVLVGDTLRHTVPEFREGAIPVFCPCVIEYHIKFCGSLTVWDILLQGRQQERRAHSVTGVAHERD
jgi:hypothetical protein